MNLKYQYFSSLSCIYDDKCFFYEPSPQSPPFAKVRCADDRKPSFAIDTLRSSAHPIAVITPFSQEGKKNDFS